MTATDAPPVKADSGNNLNGADHPNSFASRPTPKVAFPVRLEAGVFAGRPVVYIRCDWPLPQGGMAPFELCVDDPSNELVAKQSSPWGYKFIEAANLFHTVQAQVDGLMRERDDLLRDKRLLEGDLKTMQGRLDNASKVPKAKG